ncbi:cytidine deaminase [Candidatus Aciduliprofundum boonei]|uniref:cytidine deaminase n=1 Tax=Aciduliprofundum boonei (strain DSM 19572 / T469) TaxID=439481 RepID=B5ID33_ACIB4|nr:cytidine deaminase [Candidatus Aciduliprofundum boonei]ADD09200.1 cytidine deaminase [Aciduliprofundum boonei T469]EDY35870.1 cytidine deaminase [Aciduliprofundum boonei T469]HII55836.1 cytidine deaminase [Candidatus Aciduliprofundum boonei]
MDTNELIEYAKKAADNAYAPYSNFRVGAAVLACGRIFTGCNIENSSYGLTICAERVAIFKAVSEGCKNIEKIAVYAEKMPYPCGACLQVMAEFCDEECEITLTDGEKVEKYYLSRLLPKRFKLEK